MSKAKFDAAKELINEKKYAEARNILATIDHPTAREWEKKLDKLDPPVIAPKRAIQSDIQPKGVGMARTFRWVWGILTLLSCGWIVYGLATVGAAVAPLPAGVTPTAIVIKNDLGTPVGTLDSKAIQAGVAIGGGIGVIFFICTGGPLLLIFGLLYWRNGVAIRRAREHAEIVGAMGAGRTG